MTDCGRSGFRFDAWVNVIASVVLTACGTSHDAVSGNTQPDGDAALPVMSTGLCARWATIMCEGEALCCADGARAADVCVTELTGACAEEAFLDQVTQNATSGFDPAAAERAFGELEERVARCDPTIERWNWSPAGLRGALQGTLGAGESCKPSDVLSADRSMQASALVACRSVDGLACLPASLLGDWTCETKQPAAGSCLTDENCADDSYCTNLGQASLGECTPRLPLMAACVDSVVCESGYCDGERCSELDPQTVYCPAP
ncbi:MAG: hypothetical protein ABW321_10265 [Polyangiales bacterium]